MQCAFVGIGRNLRGSDFGGFGVGSFSGVCCIWCLLVCLGFGSLVYWIGFGVLGLGLLDYVCVAAGWFDWLFVIGFLVWVGFVF